MSRTKDQALYAQRQHEILQAAARVFKTKGFHLARTEEICAEAKLSPGTLFRHFPDKRAMIRAIAEIEFQNFRTEFQQIATREGILWLTRVSATDLAELLQPRGFQLGADTWLELARDPEGRVRLAALDTELRDALANELRRGQIQGWVRQNLDCSGAANIVLALFAGLSFDAEIGLGIDLESTARAMRDLFRGFLQPEPARCKT